MTFGRYLTPALAILGLAACERPQQVTTAEPTAAASEAVSSLRVAEPPLDREALLLAALRAASAASMGADDRESQRRLDGKRFELRLRFGCGGPVDDKDVRRGWSFDQDRRLLRIRAVSDITAETPLLKDLPLGAFEGAQGFWVDRPWMLAAGCPLPPPPEVVASVSAAPVLDADKAASSRSAPPAFRLGIVQLFSRDHARTHRRDGKAYEVSKSLPAGDTPSAAGYDLVVSGRLQRLTDRAVIACNAGDNPALPPSCLIGAEFDRVTIVEPGSGTVLAEWTSA